MGHCIEEAVSLPLLGRPRLRLTTGAVRGYVLAVAGTLACLSCGSGSTNATPRAASSSGSSATATASGVDPLCASSGFSPAFGSSGGVPSPLPGVDGDLALPTSPCFAKYQGIADARGLTTFNLTIGRSSPGHPNFAPTVLEGIAGESLRLHITNTTPALHNFSITAQSINVDVPAGGSVDVSVMFPARAANVYFCSFHADEGQAGELFTVSK